ncbi:MAG: hypothetical protein ACRDWA_15355 [Acidimicrobiia bacterium]
MPNFATRWLVLLMLVAVNSVLSPSAAGTRGATSSAPPPGEEEACLVWQAQGLFECFQSEKEVDGRIEELTREESGNLSMLAQCSTGLRLYDGTGYTGSVLIVLDRSLWINLSSYGFDNRTSSYKVGACSSYFAENSNGGGSWYPTSATEAWDQASSMQSGWDNRVSSVYQT